MALGRIDSFESCVALLIGLFGAAGEHGKGLKGRGRGLEDIYVRAECEGNSRKKQGVGIGGRLWAGTGQ